jgi:hypothetical protein
MYSLDSVKATEVIAPYTVHVQQRPYEMLPLHSGGWGRNAHGIVALAPRACNHLQFLFVPGGAEEQTIAPYDGTAARYLSE